MLCRIRVCVNEEPFSCYLVAGVGNSETQIFTFTDAQPSKTSMNAYKIP